MKSVADVMIELVRIAVCRDTSKTDAEGALSPKNTHDMRALSEEFLERLYALSHAHGLAQIVGYALKEQGILPEGKLGDRFEKSMLGALLRSEKQEFELLALSHVLEESHIDFIVLKGPALRRLYPEGWMRKSSDVDVLVKPEQLDAAISAIRDRMGYEVGHRNIQDVSMFSPNGVHLELHFDLVHQSVVSSCEWELISRVWEYASLAEGKSFEYKLDDAFAYFYYLVHTAKHFAQGGCGVRSVLDLWLLCHDGERDEAARAELVQRGGLEKFEAGARALAAYWFDSEQNAVDNGQNSVGGEKNTVEGELVLDMAEFILSGGRFGSFKNMAAAKKGMAKERGERSSYVVSRIFLPAEQMRSKYPTLERHPYLLPFMHVRRWVTMIANGRLSRSVAELGESAGVTSEQASAVGKMMSKLGLQ